MVGARAWSFNPTLISSASEVPRGTGPFLLSSGTSSCVRSEPRGGVFTERKRLRFRWEEVGCRYVRVRGSYV